ncbi:hypothetical protein OGATHE_005526 [Ogataea polymorpha]|uniref:Uncharacterized protein n=1 Tax=Ogataea polymorpha TaxID=460523 RepID=A0A9P8SZF5_9ASCO|nr:hypothetical protein OGATHE_005526 [Ogataea polymorpha]
MILISEEPIVSAGILTERRPGYLLKTFLRSSSLRDLSKSPTKSEVTCFGWLKRLEGVRLGSTQELSSIECLGKVTISALESDSIDSFFKLRGCVPLTSTQVSDLVAISVSNCFSSSIFVVAVWISGLWSVNMLDFVGFVTSSSFMPMLILSNCSIP